MYKLKRIAIKKEAIHITLYCRIIKPFPCISKENVKEEKNRTYWGKK